MVQEMESSATRADDLPLLYRSILDLVWQLEQTGDRQTAQRLRREATRAYSHSWTRSQELRLRDLERQLRDRLEFVDRPRRHGLGLPRLRRETSLDDPVLGHGGTSTGGSQARTGASSG